MMSKDTSKKLGVAGSAILTIALFAAIPLMYFVTDAPASLIVIALAAVIVLSAVLIYHSIQRLREIEGGLEDDIDNY